MDRSPCPVLARLDARARDALLVRASRRRIDRDEILFLAGDAPGPIHVVVRGALKLVARDVNGHETILGLATRGELVGEQAVIEHRPQPLDAIAATTSEVVTFDGNAFLSAVVRSPGASRLLMQHLAARTRWICETSLERSAGTVPARLAGRLLVLADRLGRFSGDTLEIDLPFGQRDLAQLAGMCRESACKALRELKDQGVVDYRGRRLRILRRDALERLRCAGRAGAPSRSLGAGSPRRSRSTPGT